MDGDKDREREATRLRMAKWRAENRERALEAGRVAAKKWYSKIENKAKRLEQNRQWREKNIEKSNRINREALVRSRERHPERYLWHCAKSRAKKFGIPFDLEVADIVIPEKCPALGVRMQQLAGPNSPTLDRIRPSLGYVKGNVAVICRRANLMKNDATDPAELRSVADWLESRLINDGV